MSYNAIAEMAASNSLRLRVTSCAAECDVPNPASWMTENIWRIAASPDWASTWQYAVDTLNVNMNPDIGVRNDVISDAMILAAVQNLATP